MLNPLHRSSARPWVLGISASHNGGACLLEGNRIVAAVQEERLTRTKRQRIFGAEPCLAIPYCLEAGAIRPEQLDLVVLCTQGRSRAPEHNLAFNRQLQLEAHGVPWRTISHHLGHAVSAFAGSGLAEAAILVADGMGSPFEDLSEAEQAVARGGKDGWEALSFYRASGTALTPLEKHLVPGGDWLPKRPRGMAGFRSLGGLFSAVARQIFGDNMEAGKVMGLAPYGAPVLPPGAFFDVVDGSLVFHDEVPLRFSHDRRWPEDREAYQDLACSAQQALEEALLGLAERLYQRTSLPALCFAGGVALNCVANERLIRESSFRCVIIPPAAEDSGPAVGAAYWGLWQLTGCNARKTLRCDAMGRCYDAGSIDRAAQRVPGVQTVGTGWPTVADEAVRRLAQGQIGGWFQGRSELGPRALGQRSILADPRSAETRERLNHRIKCREPFRPFAPAILAEAAGDWFELDGADADSPFMLRVWPFKAAARERVPAVVHVDGTGRVQTVHAAETPRLHALLERFRDVTGVPLLLNTSFNGRGEPIVETPEDALWCFLQHRLDFVVIEDRLFERDPEIRSLLDLEPVLTAESWTVEILLDGGRFDAWVPPGTQLKFRVHTPWGERQETVPGHLHGLLAAIDGTTDGWGLLDRLAAEGATTADADGLVETLGRLRRASVLTLRRRRQP